MYDQLENIHPDVIIKFKQTGKSQAIPKPLQDYILQLDKASHIINYNRNISRAAKKLQEIYPELSFNTCRNRIYDAINYFHFNSTVSAESWYNYYADRQEDLAQLSVAKDDMREARLCLMAAAEYRVKAAKTYIDPDKLRPKEVIISPNIDPSRLGIKEKNLKKLWSETCAFIEELPINKEEKARIKDESALNLGMQTITPIDE